MQIEDDARRENDYVPEEEDDSELLRQSTDAEAGQVVEDDETHYPVAEEENHYGHIQ